MEHYIGQDSQGVEAKEMACFPILSRGRPTPVKKKKDVEVEVGVEKKPKPWRKDTAPIRASWGCPYYLATLSITRY